MVQSKISGNILRFSFHFFVGLKLVVAESINFATGDKNMPLDAPNNNVSEKCVLCKGTNSPATTVDEMEPKNISHLYEGSASKSLLTLPNAFLHYIYYVNAIRIDFNNRITINFGHCVFEFGCASVAIFAILTLVTYKIS